MSQLLNRRNPAVAAVAVSASDVTEFQVSRAVYIGAAGDLSVVFPFNPDGSENTSNTAVVFSNVGSSVVLPIQIKMILTASTAADFVLLY